MSGLRPKRQAHTYQTTTAAARSHSPTIKHNEATAATTTSAVTIEGLSLSKNTLGKARSSGLASAGRTPVDENISFAKGTSCAKCTSRYAPNSARNMTRWRWLQPLSRRSG
jgi:hypothetical protein